MNLPDPTWPADTRWPPQQMASILGPISAWSAWYEGNPDKLASFYTALSGTQGRNMHLARPSQYAGGVVGRVARWFWGQPVPAGQNRPKLHVPVPSDIATASADLLFGEELQLDAEGRKLGRLHEILDGNDWQSLLPEAGEVCAALSGVYLRLGWDQEIASHPLISVVHADGAIPTFSWGRLVQVVFWRRVREDGGTIWRHLETHQPGRIVHQLYQGTATHLGKPVPLEESSDTRDLQVNADSAIPTGVTQLTAAYIPNVRPSRQWRTDPIGSNLGRSDFENLEPVFDAVDEVWSSWMRDLRLGKARIMVAQSLMETNGPGKGASFDLDQELFAAMNIPMDQGAQLITPHQFAIRVQEHRDTLEALLRQAYLSAGYSPATFGMADDVGVTATEVAARERRSMTTREKKSRYWTAALEPFLEAVTALDRAVFGQGEVFRPQVSFPASVSPTISEIAQSVQLLNSAQAASVDTRVRMVQPDWTDEQVAAEVQRIMAEQSMTTPTIDLPELADTTGGGLQ